MTQKAAIIVMPRNVVLGEVGTNYIKGWDMQDEQRLENVKLRNIENNNLQEVQDYLNDGEL